MTKNKIIKTKQRNIRVFEIECEDVDAVRNYITKNQALLEGLMVLLNGAKAKECSQICIEFGLCYAIFGGSDNIEKAVAKTQKHKIDENDLFANSEAAIAIAPQKVQEKIIEKIVEKVVVQTVYVDKEQDGNNVSVKSTKIIKDSTVRSGEDIVTDGDVSIFARVNSGAKIKAGGCVEIFDTIDGLVECSGEYMLVKNIGKGTVIFNGHKIDSFALDGKIKRVSMQNDKLEIKDL